MTDERIPLGTRVRTEYGKGTVKAHETYDGVFMDRYGILHDVWPASISPVRYRDDLMYFIPREIEVIHG